MEKTPAGVAVQEEVIEALMDSRTDRIIVNGIWLEFNVIFMNSVLAKFPLEYCNLSGFCNCMINYIVIVANSIFRLFLSSSHFGKVIFSVESHDF